MDHLNLLGDQVKCVKVDKKTMFDKNLLNDLF